MPVNTNHAEYTEYEPIRQRVAVVAKGTHWVKKEGVRLLPAEFAAEFPERYERYKERAYIQGVTGRTRDSLVGMVFRRPPKINVPDAMRPWLENIDGAGQSIEQQAKLVMKSILETGRYALLVDVPMAPKDVSADEEAKLGLRPTVAAYPAKSLINWRFEGVNGKQKLTLAVLQEEIDASQDEFGHEKQTIYRVLRLRNGTYTQQIYNIDASAKTDEWTPRMARREGQREGQPLDFIPLQIIGAENNLPDTDMPPLYNLAEIEIAQYRNIADLEESGFVIAQPMLHVDIGDTDEKTWSEQNPNGITFGSRHGITTVRGKVEVIQAQSDNLNMQLVNDKTAQMAQMGASLVQRGGSTETAEAARINASAEASVLETAVGNVSEGYEAALESMAIFVGIDADEVEYRLNNQFWETGLDPQALTAIMAARQGNALATRDVIHMIKAGRIELEDGRDAESVMRDVANELYDDVGGADFNNDGQ
jgi:hypothetical protein